MKQLRLALLFVLLVPVVFAFAGTSGPSPIPNPPTFQVTTNTITLCKGVVNNIPITINNLNSPLNPETMDDLQFGIAGSKYLVAVGNGQTNSITLPSNGSITTYLPVFVSLNASTLISAGISVNYNYFYYYSDSEVRNVSFGTQYCPQQLSVAVQPSVLTSGKIENVGFVLTNNGMTTLNDISFRSALPSSQGEVLTTQPVSISSIAPSAMARINESIFIFSNASQTFPINVSISMYNGTNLEQISQGIAVLSSGIINMTPSSITISPTVVSPGSIFSISFVLTDLGTASATGVTAVIPNVAGFSSFGSNSVFIGNMQVDSQTPVTMTLVASNTIKSGSYTIPIKVSYLNNLRQVLNTTIPVQVSITGFGSGSFNSVSGTRSGNYTGTRYRTRGGGDLTIIVIIVAIIVVVACLLYVRKARRKASGSQGKKAQ